MKKYLFSLAAFFQLFIFSNIANAQYCTPLYVSACSWGDDISLFQLNGETLSINNPDTEGCSYTGYSDLTDVFMADAIVGLSYTGIIGTNYSCCQFARVWIDYNDNGVFETSEIIFTSGEYSVYSPVSFSFTVPAGTTPGLKTLRVRDVYYGEDINPCMSYDYGEAHDYSIEILSGCDGPMAISSIATSGTTAEISWTTVGSPIATIIEYGVAGFTPGTGTTVTATTSPALITDLIPATIYEFTIVHECSPGNRSFPESIFEFTTPCIIPGLVSEASIGVCGSGMVTLTCSPTPHASIFWYEDYSLTTLLHIGNTYSTPELSETTTYYAIASVGDNCISDIIPVTAEVFPIPTLEITPAYQIVCINDTVNFAATYDSDYTYSWSNGETTHSILTTEPGTYTVEISDENNCSNTANSILEIYDVASVDGFDFFPEYFTDHRIVHFEPINPTAIDEYLWDFGDGNTSSEASPTHTYTEDGTYVVNLHVSNDCSSDSSEINIFVLPKNTSIDAINSLKSVLSIYPNPTNGGKSITIDLLPNSGESIRKITLINILGQIIQEIDLSLTPSYQLDIEHLSQGVYYIKVESDSHKIGIEKIIKN